MHKNIITFCVVDYLAPFICEVHGKFNIGALETIEEEFIIERPEYPKKYNGVVSFECCYDPGDYSPGGYEARWILICIGGKSIDELMKGRV